MEKNRKKMLKKKGRGRKKKNTGKGEERIMQVQEKKE